MCACAVGRDDSSVVVAVLQQCIVVHVVFPDLTVVAVGVVRWGDQAVGVRLGPQHDGGGAHTHIPASTQILSGERPAGLSRCF